ncbi:sensor histidine kinase [Roseateles sp. BYS78W]|uniref:histidine kinase n=1 Tax=Pelomonas candidula TaxID=3299025 RepID=A0ABW7HBI6_9BURK
MKPLRSQYNWRVHLGGTVGICVVVGLLNYLFRGEAFWLGMLYSFAIGVQISVYVALLQTAVAWLLVRRYGDVSILRSVWVSWGLMLPCLMVASVIGYTGGIWLADWVSGQQSLAPWELADHRVTRSIAFTLLASVLGSMVFVWTFKLNALKLDQAEALRQAAEARLALLQSQLEPHMLFNTLAHLRVLIKRQPDEAQRMLDRLIDYLRATLQASRATEHALADEFERLSDYLALMQLRMGQRLHVRLDLPAGVVGTAIPPLLLQPLVENAIKHGLEPHEAGGELRVSAARDGERLVLEVADSGAGLGDTSALADVGTGFGLAQVRERLAHRYGDTARFELKPKPGGGSVARIEIPLT